VDSDFWLKVVIIQAWATTIIMLAVIVIVNVIELIVIAGSGVLETEIVLVEYWRPRLRRGP
jgi:hypothetical protein